MKILAVQSSNRPTGLTADLARAVLRGAEQRAEELGEKALTELVNLNEHKINVCQACGEAGWGASLSWVWPPQAGRAPVLRLRSGTSKAT